MVLVKRYRFFLVTLALLIGISFVQQEIGKRAMDVIGFSFREMILIIPPVFIMLGLLDVWIPRETMVRFMGDGSGLKGILIAILLGSAAAGPLYAAFPVASVFMKKGAKFTNVLIFLGAWSTTKIPMFLFELSALGTRFAVTRLLVDIPGIIIIAHILSRMAGRKELKRLYQKAESS